MGLTELIARAPWREAVTYRDTWPHEYVLLQKDDQRELLEAVCQRLRNGEGVPCRFFAMCNAYLFIGDYKYWLMTPPDQVDWDDADRGRYGLKSGCDIAWEGAPPSGILVVRPPDAGDPRCAFPANAIRCKKRLNRIYLTSPSHN